MRECGVSKEVLVETDYSERAIALGAVEKAEFFGMLNHNEREWCDGYSCKHI
jgi:hypothetical protein